MSDKVYPYRENIFKNPYGDQVYICPEQGQTLNIDAVISNASLTDTKMLYSNAGVISSAENVVYSSGLTSVNNSFALNGDLQYITQLSDLPTAIAGVINLVPSKTYEFLGNIDLVGNRLESTGITVIKGSSSEVASITSTGLGAGIPLLTTQTTTVLQNITFKNIDTCFFVSGNADPNKALDWDKFNIENCPNIGVIENVSNFLLTNSAFLNSSNLIFDGTINTIGFLNCLFTNFNNGTTSIVIPSSATIARRLKIVDSSMIATGTASAINFNVLATAPSQSYVLSTVNFSGGGTYLQGVQSSSNKALFFNCIGIPNSRSLCEYYASTILPTTIPLANTFYKINCLTSPDPLNQKFTHTNNRATYTGTLDQLARLNYSCSLSGSANDIIYVGISIDGANPVNAGSYTITTLDPAGRSSALSLSKVVELVENRYFELWINNISAARTVQADSLHFSVLGQV